MELFCRLSFGVVVTVIVLFFEIVDGLLFVDCVRLEVAPK